MLCDAIQCKHPIMLSDGVIILHDNASPILLTKLKYYCKSSIGKTGISPIQPRFVIQWLLPILEIEGNTYLVIIILRHTCRSENSWRGLAQWAVIYERQKYVLKMKYWFSYCLPISLIPKHEWGIIIRIMYNGVMNRF